MKVSRLAALAALLLIWSAITVGIQIHVQRWAQSSPEIWAAETPTELRIYLDALPVNSLAAWRWREYFEAAAKEWSEISGVPIRIVKRRLQANVIAKGDSFAAIRRRRKLSASATAAYFSDTREIIFDSDREWWHDWGKSYGGPASGSQVSAYPLILHELGHALGLNHLPQGTDAVMVPHPTIFVYRLTGDDAAFYKETQALKAREKRKGAKDGVERPAHGLPTEKTQRDRALGENQRASPLGNPADLRRRGGTDASRRRDHRLCGIAVDRKRTATIDQPPRELSPLLESWWRQLSLCDLRRDVMR